MGYREEPLTNVRELNERGVLTRVNRSESGQHVMRCRVGACRDFEIEEDE